MNDRVNRRWVLAAHPQGMPVMQDWRMEEAEMPEIAAGEVLARALYLSVDPYMRGRISSKQGYAKGVEVGDLMVGGAVAEIVESRHPDWRPGDLIETMQFGWQEHAALQGNALTKVLPEIGPPHAWLSYLGMPGVTAWCALHDAGGMKAGETILISAASGAVGQVAGQLAKAADCRAVAVASSDDKLRWCRELGYDATVNYRTSTDLRADLAAACGDGIDIFLDNTAGPIHDAAMQSLALGARIIVVGTVSLSGKLEQPDIGERFLRQILVARASVKGFLVFDHLDRYAAAREGIARLASDGKLRFKTDFLDGIESMPEAFLRLLHSKNFGKQLVRTEHAAGLAE